MIDSFHRADEREAFLLIQRTIQPEHTAVKLITAPPLPGNVLTRIVGFVLFDADGETEFGMDGIAVRATAHYSVEAFK